MRKAKMMIMLIIGLVYNSFGQQYVPFPIANANWNVIYAGTCQDVRPDGTHATTVTIGNIVTVINPDGTHSVGTLQTAVEASQSRISGKNAHMDSLYFVWESDTLYQKPESAVYDSHDGIIYVSNINGKYLARDGNGFISRLSCDGKTETLKWIDGLNNPQGLGIYKRKLFVADINRVVRIDLDKACVDKVWEIPEAVFLNDISTDNNGDVYVSECRLNKIYRIHRDEVKLWLSDSLLSSPNGLLCSYPQLMLLNMKDGKVFRINKRTGHLTEFSNGIKNADGITGDGSDGYFVSGAWQGEVFHIDGRGTKRLLLDLGKNKKIAADICYIPSQRMLIIPTLQKTVMAFQYK